MNFFENPFYILGLTTRDSKQKIVEVCDEKSLTLDADSCTRFRNMLTHPRNRIAAEISWLPGVAPARALNLLKAIKTEPQLLNSSISGFNPLVKCNIAAAFLSYHKPKKTSQIISLLIAMNRAFDEIKNESLLSVINEDRHLAGLPLIQGSEIVKEAIQEHRKYLAGVMKDVLNNVQDPDIVFTKIVEQVTSHGKEHPPVLIDDITDLYQIEVQKHLDKLSEQIKAITKDIQSHNLQEIDAVLNRLENKVRGWDQIAQPIQLVMQSKGIEDSHSQEIANELRNTAVCLANKMGMHEEAQKIFTLLSEVFKELPQFAERISEDISTLEDILDRKAKNDEEEKKWREDVSLDIEIGKIFKNRLIISPEFISYKGLSIKTDEVSRVNWGVFVQYTNGIRTNSSYTIGVGTPRYLLEIECNTTFESLSTVEKRYEAIIDRLWKIVGVRLFTETLHSLSSGEKLVYGDALVDKDGILLKKYKFFGEDTPFYSKWENLSISNGPGSFIIQSTIDKKAKVELSYRDAVYNVHILEAIMRFLWKDGNYQKLRRGEFSKSSHDSI